MHPDDRYDMWNEDGYGRLTRRRTMTTEEELLAKLDALRSNVRALLDVIGGKSQCRACGADIWFVKTKNGKSAPYTAEALSHFADCPKAESFRKKTT